MQYNFSYIKDELLASAKTPFIGEVSGRGFTSSLERFGETACKTAIAPAIFNGNIKTKANFKECQWLYYDWDDGATHTDIVKIMKDKNISGIILASKNHMKDKGDGKGIIERFHLLIPLAQPITDVAFHRWLLKETATTMELTGYDTQCIDSTRFFAKHSNILYRQEGEPYAAHDLIGWYNRLQRYESSLKAKAEAKRMKEIERYGEVDPAIREQALTRLINESPEAIEGAAGDKSCYLTAWRIAKFGGNISHLKRYNQEKCKPPFSASQIEHKWQGAVKAVGCSVYGTKFLTKYSKGER